MQNKRVKSKYLWFRCSILIGLLLGLLLLVQTVRTYRYVARGLVRQEAQREADRRTASIARSARLAGIHASSGLTPVLNELVQEAPKQIAWIRILSMDGKVVAQTEHVSAAPSYSPEQLRSLLEQQERQPRERTTPSGPVLLTLNPLHIGPPNERQFRSHRGRPPELEFVEIALYVDGISVHFGPLRQNLIIGVSAAFALLGAVIIIGLRFRNYLHGKEIEKELALARRVQLYLFPNDSSAFTQVQFAAQCVPSWQVGGDLYDVFQTDDGEIALVLGDVSGKGLSAALLMGVVQGAVRASCGMSSAANHEQAAERLNRLLCEKTARERFVSLFWGYFNPQESVLRYINAGHWPPLLARGGAEMREVLRLERAGPVLGVLPAARYEQAETAVQSGDLLVVFSDGILEATDAREQEFGEERLIAAIERNWTKSPFEICRAILADVQSFLGKEIPHDDQTLVVARLEPAHTKPIPSTEIARAARV